VFVVRPNARTISNSRKTEAKEDGGTVINRNYVGFVLMLATSLTLYLLLKRFEPAACDGFIAALAILGAARAIWPHQATAK